MNVVLWFGIILVFVFFYYLLCFGRKPKITIKPGNLVSQSIVAKCGSFREIYWPLFVVVSNEWFQLVFMTIKERLWGKSQSKLPNYQREIVTLSDGQTVALDWVFSSNTNNSNSSNRNNEINEKQGKKTKQKQKQKQSGSFAYAKLIENRNNDKNDHDDKTEQMTKIEIDDSKDNSGGDINIDDNINDINNNDGVPIVVHSYGITGTNKGFSEISTCNLIVNKLKWHFVIVNRRGHDPQDECKLTVPKLSVFGYLDDFHECLLYIHDKYPNNPLILFGLSAGTSVQVRYLGDIGIKMRLLRLKHYLSGNKSNENINITTHDTVKVEEYYNKLEKLAIHLNLANINKYPRYEEVSNKIIGFVALCPGYDISCCFERMTWLAKKVLFDLINDFFIDHKNNIGFDKFNLLKKIKFQSYSQFIRIYSCMIGGYHTYEEFLMENNAIITAKYMNHYGLIINSEDDPICKLSNVDDWRHLLEDKEDYIDDVVYYENKDDNNNDNINVGYLMSNLPNLIHLQTKFGSHCAFFDIFGNLWSDKIVCQYLKTLYQMKQKKLL